MKRQYHRQLEHTMPRAEKSSTDPLVKKGHDVENPPDMDRSLKRDHTSENSTVECLRCIVIILLILALCIYNISAINDTDGSGSGTFTDNNAEYGVIVLVLIIIAICLCLVLLANEGPDSILCGCFSGLLCCGCCAECHNNDQCCDDCDNCCECC